MESTGVPGRIQVSPSFEACIVDRSLFDLIPRDNVEVKGKGTMSTYILDQANSVSEVIASNRSSICMEWDNALGLEQGLSASVSVLPRSPLVRGERGRLGRGPNERCHPIFTIEEAGSRNGTLDRRTVAADAPRTETHKTQETASPPAYLRVEVIAGGDITEVIHVSSHLTVQDVMESVMCDSAARRLPAYIDAGRKQMVVSSMSLALLWQAQRAVDNDDDFDVPEEGEPLLCIFTQPLSTRSRVATVMGKTSSSANISVSAAESSSV
jgi:hypothetical protein